LKEKFVARMHVLLSDIAELDGKTPEEAKEELKKGLIKEGTIKSSTKELSVKQLAVVCNSLESVIKSKHG
jgi:hypothetical protein